METTQEHYYQSLYEIAAALNSTRAPEAIPRSIVESLARAVGAKGCSLMLLTPDKKTLIHNVAYGLSDWYVRKGPVSVDNSISESLEGKPVAVLDASKDERIQYREQAKKEGNQELRELMAAIVDCCRRHGSPETSLLIQGLEEGSMRELVCALGLDEGEYGGQPAGLVAERWRRDFLIRRLKKNQEALNKLLKQATEGGSGEGLVELLAQKQELDRQLGDLKGVP